MGDDSRRVALRRHRSLSAEARGRWLQGSLSTFSADDDAAATFADEGDRDADSDDANYNSDCAADDMLMTTSLLTSLLLMLIIKMLCCAACVCRGCGEWRVFGVSVCVVSAIMVIVAIVSYFNVIVAL